MISYLDSSVSGLAAAVFGAESPESTRPEAESIRETSVEPLVPDWKGVVRGQGGQGSHAPHPVGEAWNFPHFVGEPQWVR